MGRSGGKAKVNTGAKSRSRTSIARIATVEGTPFSEEELIKYVRQIIKASGAEAGDRIFYDLWDPSENPYVEEMARQAENMGVDFQVIVPETDPTFKDQVEDLVRSGAIKIGPEFPDYAYNPDDNASGNVFAVEEYDKEYSAGNIRWINSIIPNQAWADRVYPEIDDPKERLRALGEDFQKFLRIHEESEETWEEHIENLKKRAEAITQMEPESFSFTSAPDQLYPGDPGTDLVLEPIEGARYIPVEMETDSGHKTIVNSPTEEVFFTPKPGSANGRASMAKPYFASSKDGQAEIEIRGVVLEYKDGEVVAAYSLLDPEHDDLLKRDFIESGSDNGQKYLGEIGLVDPESPIAKTNKTYHTAIIDENSASHGGHGMAWAFSIEPEALAKGVLPKEIAEAEVHKDLTFGSPHLDISLRGKDGRKHDLAKGGKWVGP